MSPRSTTPSAPSALRRALRNLGRRAGRAVSAVADGLAGVFPPPRPGRQPVLVPVPVRSTRPNRRD